MQKNRLISCGFCLILAFEPQVAWSSDACLPRAVIAAADVTVSDGSRFKIESAFQNENIAAIQHIREDAQVIAVEGPLSWTRRGDKSEAGTGFHKAFALGHQFHAFLVYFDDLVRNARRSDRVSFESDTASARTGDFTYGGTVHLVEDGQSGLPRGLIFDFPDAKPVTVRFQDWRKLDNRMLLFRLHIDDGERQFDYRYSSIYVAEKSPGWYFKHIQAPDIDEVKLYRLHRNLLAAHCLGNADLMAQLSAEKLVIVGRGALNEVSNDALRERFGKVFETLNYAEYHDIVPPRIHVSKQGDIAWLAANVRAVGNAIASGDTFDDQWAWIMTAEKIGGVWVHTGNASNRLP